MKEDDLLINIFNDCIIRDIDFSKWSFSISLLVHSQNIQSMYRKGQRALFELRLLGVSEFKVSFHHKEDTKYTWCISSIDLESNDTNIMILKDSGEMPAIRVGFSYYELIEIDIDSLYKENSHWDKNSEFIHNWRIISEK